MAIQKLVKKESYLGIDYDLVVDNPNGNGLWETYLYYVSFHIDGKEAGGVQLTGYQVVHNLDFVRSAVRHHIKASYYDEDFFELERTQINSFIEAGFVPEQYIKKDS